MRKEYYDQNPLDFIVIILRSQQFCCIPAKQEKEFPFFLDFLFVSNFLLLFPTSSKFYIKIENSMTQDTLLDILADISLTDEQLFEGTQTKGITCKF